MLLAGGGTAGHVSPLLALADCLRRRDPQVPVTALGTAAGLEARLVPERGYPLLEVPKVPFPRRPSGDLLRLPANLRRAVRAAEDAIDSTGAEVVVGFGGYVSTPAYLAARRRGTPIVVHEQNARPGLANRLGARLAAGVGVTFPDTHLPHATLTGMPLRREIATLDRAAHRAEARERFGLTDAPTVLVTGGSLGAQRLNDAFAGAAAALSAAGVQVLHVAGTGKGSCPTGWPAPPTSCSSTATGWTSPTPLPTWSSPAPAPTRCASSPPSGCPRSTCRCRSATASSGSTPPPSSPPVAGCSSTTTPSPRRGSVTSCGPSPLDEARLATMAAAAASVGERGGDELLADLVVAAARGGRP